MLVDYQPGYYQPETISFEKVQALMGFPLSPDDWTEEAKAEALSEITKAAADQRAVQHASMTDALGESDRLFSYRGENRSISEPSICGT